MEMLVDYVGPDQLDCQPHVPQVHPPDVDVDTQHELKDLSGDTLVRSPVFDGGENMDFQGNQAHIAFRKPARRAQGKVLRIRNRMGRSKYVGSNQDTCILTPEWYKMVCNWAGGAFLPQLNHLSKFQGDHAYQPNLSSTSSTHQQKKRMWPMVCFVPCRDHTLFLHPKESESAGMVKRCRCDGARGVIIVLVSTKESWFWSLAEVTVNWWDLHRDETIF